NSFLQGAWALLMSRYSGQEDIVFGAVTSGRPTTLARAESMVGLFINTMPIRIQVSPEESLLPWLHKIQEFLVEVGQYEYCPLMKIQGWSEIAKGFPLFESLVIFENYAVDESLKQNNTNLEIESSPGFEKTNYSITLTVVPDQKILLRILVNDTSRFDHNTLSQMLGHLKNLLEDMVANQQQRIGDLAILTEAEQQKLLVEWNDTAVPYPQEKCIHQLFEAQVEKTTDAVAVAFENEELSYGELNTRVNQLAHYLRSLGVKPDVLVGICVERSLTMLIGLLAILKAGGSYIPLDPSYPKERLSYILKDSNASVLLTQTSLLEILPDNQAKLVCWDRDEELIAQQNLENPDFSVTPDNLAYIIYTSGSTGKPKGVQILHSALSNFLHSMQETPGITAEDTLLAVTTYSFDIAALELFLPIITGARLVIASRETTVDGEQLLGKLQESGATIMQATPASWQLLLAAGWAGKNKLKVLCGGEALPRKLANQLLERAGSVWNMYGPTETTIWSAVAQITNESKIISIGRAIANTQIHILDKYNQLVPIGVTGELCIGGAGLAKGYLNRPDLTTEKFIPNPFNTDNSKLYKTGDLARYLPNGEIECLGRIDHQVKLRGFRIELGEIETVISQNPEVAKAVVAIREDAKKYKRLVAYIIPQKEQSLTIAELREFLASKLPNYMIPSAIVTLEVFPLTPNGKIDRKDLPAPEITRSQLSQELVEPRNDIERKLTKIWVEVLDVDLVGINDNFFELGGDSILAIVAITKANQEDNLQLTVKQLFQHQTVAELATVAVPKTINQIEQKISDTSPKIEKEQPSRFSKANLDQQDLERFLAKVKKGSNNQQK
ncbi:MAG: amino acid adenylation domain-containing protein, partial [Cyanobacteria bacterium P01_F01_bin.143]